MNLTGDIRLAASGPLKTAIHSFNKHFTLGMAREKVLLLVVKIMKMKILFI